MFLIDLSARHARLSDAERLNAVIREFGVLRVVRAALIVAIRKRPARVARAFENDLPDYIRRDVGLPPRAEPPCHHRHLY